MLCYLQSQSEVARVARYAALACVTVFTGVEKRLHNHATFSPNIGLNHRAGAEDHLKTKNSAVLLLLAVVVVLLLQMTLRICMRTDRELTCISA